MVKDTELIKRDDYLSAGVHIGMKNKTKQMEEYIYKTRPDGLAVLNVKKTDEKIKAAGKFLSRYENILFISRKKNGQIPVKKAAEAVDGDVVVDRFLPGTLTNPQSPNYKEPDVIVVTDPLADKQAIDEAVKERIPVVGVCDTFNELDYIDFVIPANNKGRKSLGLILYLLSREILKNRGKSDKDFYTLEDFQGETKPQS